MQRFANILKNIIHQDWSLNIWYYIPICFIIFLIILIFTRSIDTKVVISAQAFIALYGSVATLSGVMLGLIIASMASIVQQYTTSLNITKAELVKESDWLNCYLKENKISDSELLSKLESIQLKCLSASLITHDVHTESIKMIEDITTYLREIDDSEETNSVKSVPLFYDLMNHLYLSLLSLFKAAVSQLSAELLVNLKKLASSISVILVSSLVFLLFSELQINDTYFLSNVMKIILALVLVCFFIPTFRLIFEVISLYARINTLEKGYI